MPELAPYRTMRWQVEHRSEGYFVAESDKVVQRLLESPCPVISLLMPDKWLRHFEPLLSRRKEEISVYLIEKSRLESLTGFTFYQGVLALGKVPVIPSLESVLNAGGFPRLLAAVEGITSAENLGGLVRSCVAFGAQAILVDRKSCSPFLRRAIRASMGTIFTFPAVEGLELVKTVTSLTAQGFSCVAAHPHATQKSIFDTDFSRDCCVVFGSEGNGISPELLGQCSEVVAIPMAQGVDSLNVGSAAAVFMYEVTRQRQRILPSPS